MDDPELYVKTNFMQKRDAELVMEKFLGNMKSVNNETILDIGSGPGNITGEVLYPKFPNGTQIVGIDIAHVMKDYAAKNFLKRGLKFETLDITDAAKVQEFRATWGKFTKIFSFYCLHWIKDHRKVLRSVNDLLQEGGECLLMFVAQCPVFKMYEVMAKDSNWTTYMTDVENFVPSTQHSSNPTEDFSLLMKQANLEVKSCTLLDESFTFNTVEMLKDCMRVVNPFISRLPAEKVNAYINHCLLTLSNLRSGDSSADEGAGHKFAYKLLVAHGSKPYGSVKKQRTS